MGSLQEQPRRRIRSRIPRLIVHLERPVRVDVVADDLDEAIAAQRVARVVGWLLERLPMAAA